MDNCDYKKELLFKFLVLGDYGVGKTSIIRRYAEDTFSSTYKITIGADFALKRLTWNDHTIINLQLWDIAGGERFGLLTSVYYRYALAAAIVFDLTRPETLASLNEWINDLRERVHLPTGKSIPIVLLANKGDIAIENINEKELNDFCIKKNILRWFITSAKENINLDEAMNILIKISVQNYSNSNFGISQKIPSKIVIREDEKKNTHKKWSCLIL